MISLREIIKRCNDIDKIKAFLFDENTINIFQNLKNPNLINLRDETNNIWTEAIFTEDDVNHENYENKLNEVVNKQNKIFIENNIEKIISIIGA
jgi:hypothetical protein